MVYNRQDILDWYENRKGKDFICTYIPNQAKFIDNFYLCNNNSCNENAGVYMIKFNNKAVYIGQAGNIAYRLITHIYNLVNKKTEWGIELYYIENGYINLDISILEDSILNENKRKQKEYEYINLELPILQNCYEKYYPYDKAKKYSNGKWMKRKDIPADWCIRKALRKEAIKENLKLENIRD